MPRRPRRRFETKDPRDYERWRDRASFMTALLIEAPTVAEALWNDVHPLFVETIAEHQEVETLDELRREADAVVAERLIAWACAFNLDVPWIYEHALATLRAWPRDRQEERPVWWLPPMVYGPLRKGGAKRVKMGDHLRWLAMYQVRGMSAAAIAREEERRFASRPAARAKLGELTRNRALQASAGHVRAAVDAYEKAESGRLSLEAQTVDEAVRRLATDLGLPLRGLGSRKRPR